MLIYQSTISCGQRYKNRIELTWSPFQFQDSTLDTQVTTGYMSWTLPTSLTWPGTIQIISLLALKQNMCSLRKLSEFGYIFTTCEPLHQTQVLTFPFLIYLQFLYRWNKWYNTLYIHTEGIDKMQGRMNVINRSDPILRLLSCEHNKSLLNFAWVIGKTTWGAKVFDLFLC